MGDLVVSDVRVEGLITVLALDVTDLVGPPHDRFPVRLVVFQEHFVIVWVLSQSNNNILGISGLSPLHRLEREDLQSLSDVKNGSLFSSRVLQVNASASCVFVLWKHVNAALGQFHEQDTWMKLLVHQVL